MSKLEQRKTIQDISAAKAGDPLVCLTAYTTRVAQVLDQYCDLLLVGDTMGMILYGMENTRGVTLDMVIHHGRAVMRGSQKACVIVDMPYGTYEKSPEQALNNAKRIMQETSCSGIKLEGGADFAPTIKHLVANDVPVIAHIGLLPQSVEEASGFKVQGKTDDAQKQLFEDARAVEAAGASAVVIEATIETVAQAITGMVSVPTIGIGASSACDGQILVTEDMLGLTDGHVPKFVKQYAQLSDEMDKAAAAYAADVRKRTFPASEHVYSPTKMPENAKKKSA